jgi:hypothetical protein
MDRGLRPVLRTLGVLAFATATVGVIGSPVFGASSPTTTAAKTATTAKKRASAEEVKLQQAIAEAQSFVEKERELKFKTKPRVQILASGPFLQRFETLRASDPEYEQDIASFSSLLRSLGMVQGKGDPKKLLDTLLSGGVGGFYDSKTKELVVRSGSIGPSTKATIVHELVHALEDQHFDLERPELDTRTDDSSGGFQFLAEGSARYIENRYRDTFTAAEEADARREEEAMGDQEALLKVFLDPDYTRGVPFLIVSLLSPYEQGKEFIAEVVKAKGMKGLNAVYARPPITTEEATSYGAYLKNTKPVGVPTPEIPANAKKLDSGVVGQASLNAILADENSLQKAELTVAAALGWAGDAYVVWEDKKQQCFRADFTMETAKDVTELDSALKGFARRAPQATVEKRPGSQVRLTSCSAAAR